MNQRWRSLRIRLAALGFLAIYVPALLLFGVILATDTETVSTVRAGATDTETTTRHLSGWAFGTLIALGPVAAALAWWWAGRAVRPLHQVRAVAEDIEATDLSRRTGLDNGPIEVTALAASFDAMLDRLEAAAETQRRLIEEASHELRLPLSVLMTNAEVILAHPAPTADIYRQALERSRKAADRLQRTIEELLVDARGRARTISRRPTDLMVTLREIAGDAAVLAAVRQVTLSVTGPPSAVCRVDEPTVRRAISNLVDNAIRYAPAGSTVGVHIETTPAQVAVVVTDHGPGIPPDQQERILERFWRGGDSGPGAGLGLPIAGQIAQAHGGTVTVTSPGPSGDGSVFRLTLRP
ncbi:MULTISPECIES: HAMP domain-containing sensor histidine kinase [unclassified Nonomuraea]|uniref:HAMP domain-containing sensor histidine kinase n=1 Tax=unclassified Nonomuraea TaxID=2593643 RepID=UPI0035C26795